MTTEFLRDNALSDATPDVSTEPSNGLSDRKELGDTKEGAELTGGVKRGPAFDVEDFADAMEVWKGFIPRTQMLGGMKSGTPLLRTSQLV
jgi:hypothetical protein